MDTETHSSLARLARKWRCPLAEVATRIVATEVDNMESDYAHFQAATASGRKPAFTPGKLKAILKAQREVRRNRLSTI